MSQAEKKTIWVGLSGGVDSSVAAAHLVDEGHDVTGVYLKCWEDVLPDGSCPWEKDQKDAQAVAQQLRIPFKSINLVPQYRERVFRYMVEEYAAGKTPNPDVVCNREIKFGLFLEEALADGADAIATGHYARLRTGTAPPLAPGGLSPLRLHLLAGTDKNKDQSYFLWQLKQEQLRHALFPVGHMNKSDVRLEARKRGFQTAEKPDSTGVCFVGEVPMQEFLAQFIQERPGPVFTTAGKQVGEHKGLAYYTIGQRKGIGIFGGGPPYYVAEKDSSRNALIVAAPAETGSALYSDELTAHSVNWFDERGPTSLMRVKARIRYRQPLQDATINYRGPTNIVVTFDEPQRAVTPGQSVVLYDLAGEELLGGGIIS